MRLTTVPTLSGGAGRDCASRRDRVRLLGAYLLVGLTFSLVVGIVVVLKGYAETGMSMFW